MSEPATMAAMWKVGALARHAGVTVRTLHHYDHLGLLTPSARSTGGHRLYTGDDLARLYRISLLRRLGFGLEQIAGIPSWQLPAAVRRHLDDLTHRIDVAVALRARLAALAEQLSHRSPAPSELFTVLEEMTMLDPTVHTTGRGRCRLGA